ncbi:hypothetical protein CC86DRAFT_386583 [Ophiobolus disseminans]|uniref:Uncharacterized protein n=1 Tax=Ophiobolus disseminans TaxID=1469910 RepID=A0A6A6ZJG2_9PLEO|nr:hypothetical protein CC86DRAFT_386583 [Ophiobolus disseminans]
MDWLSLSVLNIAVCQGYLEALVKVQQHDYAEFVRRVMDEANLDGLSPIHFAAICGRTNIIKHFRDHSSNQDILKTMDGRCRTPMHLAAMSGHVGVVDLLLNEVPECPHVVNNKERKPAWYAEKGGYWEIQKQIDTFVKPIEWPPSTSTSKSAFTAGSAPAPMPASIPPPPPPSSTLVTSSTVVPGSYMYTSTDNAPYVISLRLTDALLAVTRPHDVFPSDSKGPLSAPSDLECEPPNSPRSLTARTDTIDVAKRLPSSDMSHRCGVCNLTFCTLGAKRYVFSTTH